MIKQSVWNVDKMYTYLRGYLIGANLQNSINALQFARQKHEGQIRKDGAPYIAHPLSMACYAVALGIKDDNIIATILLHDVVEDCNVPVEFLPVNDTIKYAVQKMTVKKLDTDTSKIETKCRYFNELLDSKEAIICKALDRYNNLADMPFALSEKAIGKNCAETDILLLPILKIAKEKWTDLKAQAMQKASMKIVESVASQNGTHTVSVIDVADKLLNKIESLIDAEGLTISNVKDLASAIKNLKEIKGIKSEIDLKEQKARIKKLEKEIEANTPNGDKPYGVVLMPPIMPELTPPKEEDDG